MSEYGNTPDYEIAALKKKEEGAYNLMLPGHGTPWEDRGATGMFPAFFKTALQSLTAHKSLLDQIRRPETKSEATGFAIGCAAIWALSVPIWDYYWFRVYSSDTLHWQVDSSQFLLETGLRVVGVFLGVLVLLKLGVSLFTHLAANSLKQQIPPALTHNVFAYSLGPSLLAIVPLFGWALAGIWILVDVVIGAATRLYIRPREVVVNVVLTTLVLLAISIGAYFAVSFVWTHLLMDPSVTPFVPLRVPGQGGDAP